MPKSSTPPYPGASAFPEPERPDLPFLSGILLAAQQSMHLVVGNRPSRRSEEVRFFRFLSAQGILGDLDDGGVQFEPQEPSRQRDRADDREPGTRQDGEAMPPDSLDPEAGDEQQGDVERDDSTAITPPGRHKDERTTL
jgi:hypothetical protein